jgi:hypothetical protein
MRLIGFRPILLILITVLFSCSTMRTGQNIGYISHFRRAPASSVDLNRLEQLLAIDRFDYYRTEYINNFGHKIDEASLKRLQKVTTKNIISRFGSDQRIYDAKKYDALVYELIAEGQSSLPLKKSAYQWGYNFFKNKLNDAYQLADTRLESAPEKAQHVKEVEHSSSTMEDIPFKEKDLTLEAGHYISNRTTRAVFWEAVESNRDIEFHLENSREFLKNLSESGATVVKEIRPFANNYNKIYVVQYPGESTYRYAITNIGGKDRLKHLMMQFGLSKLTNKKLKNKVRIYGDIDQSHKVMSDELTGMMKHLPKADQVIIGQKGAIERTLDLLWKVRALKNLYDQDPDGALGGLKDKDRELLKELFVNGDIEEFDIFKKKKVIEAQYSKKDKKIKDLSLAPREFKSYDYDNFVISMSDFVFNNEQGKTIRWRVVANSWGDEISPLANAIKNSGHKKITYIGTAGAFPNKGYQVGDLVIPTHVQIGASKRKLNGDALSIDGAKVGGNVEHVYSPFQETYEWLENSSKKADFVEVETSHLRKILNASDTDLRAYLLISDILTNEGETLASASSSKRRNALNKLLYSILERDKVGIPNEAPVDKSSVASLRNLILETIPKKGKAFQYYTFSALKDAGVSSTSEVEGFVSSVDNFSDKFFSDRLVATSEVVSHIVREISEYLPTPKLAIDKDFVDGKWHPKNGKISINLYASTAENVKLYERILEDYADEIENISKWTSVNVVRGPPSKEFVTLPKYVTKESDFLLQTFSQASFKQSGLDAQVTYNGNVKFNFIPTSDVSDVCVDDKFCHLSFFSPDQTTKELLETVDTKQKLKTLTGLDIDTFFKEKFEDLREHIADISETEDFVGDIKVVKNAQLEDGKLAELTPTFHKTKGLLIEMKFTAEGWKNPVVVLEELIHLEQIITRQEIFKHPILWAELSLNAKHGSYRSRRFLAEAEVDAMDRMMNLFSSEFVENDQVISYIQSRKAHAMEIVKKLSKNEREEKKLRKGITARWKSLQSQLEKEDLKLDDYIAANNRKKVAELIDAYMPWEEMEPTEVAAWTRWIKAIASPSKKKADKMITFRGVADDLVRESNDGGHFLMAKLLTKNQGNYTRRLRSLKTYFDKKLGPQVKYQMPVEVSSLAAAFKSHSKEPVGSPWLSTSNFEVATNFAGANDKRAAILIDKKRNLLNLVSNYEEFEQMAPLIIFPDEIIYLSEEEEHNVFIKKVEQKLGRKLTIDEKEGDYGERIKEKLEATREWWETINPQGITPGTAGKTCKDVIELFKANR